MSVDVFPNTNTDAAGRRALDVDAKLRGRFLGGGLAQKFMRVFDGVRVRKQITQAEPNAAVVCMSRQRRRVIQTPIPNRASLKARLHAEFLFELSTETVRR
jgi:hypothetical protein